MRAIKIHPLLFLLPLYVVLHEVAAAAATAATATATTKGVLQQHKRHSDKSQILLRGEEKPLLHGEGEVTSSRPNFLPLFMELGLERKSDTSDN